MRTATKELKEIIIQRYPVQLEKGYPYLAKAMNLECKYMPVLWRIVNEAAGVSWMKENEIRRAINEKELPPEKEVFNPRILKAIRKKGDPRPFRTSLQVTDKNVAEMIRHEAKRQGITITKYLANITGVSYD